MSDLLYKKELYYNQLTGPADIEGWRMEGDGEAFFPNGRLQLKGTRDPKDGQKSNIVFWCPEEFPDNISIAWDFTPIQEPGLCIMFFAARGINGEDIFDPALKKRSGPYDQYNNSDINALHISYFRRKYPKERNFTICNLRKSKGFHLVAQGADPLPSVPDATGPYRVEVIKFGPEVRFLIGKKDKEPLELFRWTDDATAFGPMLEGGKIGFRQMTPMIGEYANLTITQLGRK